MARSNGHRGKGDIRTELPGAAIVTMYPRQDMPLVMYSDVILTRDVTEHGLGAGDVGTVVERHAVTGVPRRAVPSSFDIPRIQWQLPRSPRVPCACPPLPIGQPSELSA